MAKGDRNADVFDLERLRNLMELMKEYGLNELELCQSEQEIRISRGGTSGPVMMAPQAMPMMAAPAAPAPAVSAATPAAAGGDEKNIAYIKSPMVGTFYSRPNPNSESFVKVGDHVSPEKTICIIEAMKVFNEIPAEIKGKIVAVLVEEEEPVDFGKPLFKVDTSA